MNETMSLEQMLEQFVTDKEAEALEVTDITPQEAVESKAKRKKVVRPTEVDVPADATLRDGAWCSADYQARQKADPAWTAAASKAERSAINSRLWRETKSVQASWNKQVRLRVTA